MSYSIWTRAGNWRFAGTIQTRWISLNWSNYPQQNCVSGKRQARQEKAIYAKMLEIEKEWVQQAIQT